MKPLAIDLFTGLHGWAEGFISEGWRVVGFDIVDMCAETGQSRPDGVELVLQDVLTIHGSQFKDADAILCSPPCQKYSWLAMPWSRSKSEHSQAAKTLRREWETNGPDNRLFDACFRIQREACEAAGRYIPLIVENVRGCQEWTRRADWNFGSYYLWGDIPALMPSGKTLKTQGGSWFRERNGVPQPGIRHEDRGVKVESLDGGRRTDVGKGARFTSRDCGIEAAGLKIGGDWFSDPNSTCQKHGSRSKARKAASAQIAKIPFPLSSHIARVFYPRDKERVA